MTMSVEPPPPSPEQLADWQGLVERIRQGDRSEVMAWDEVAAARSAGTYQVLVTQRVHQRLRGAPPLVAGSVAGIVAVLRVDPIEASTMFRRRRLGDGGWTVTFGIVSIIAGVVAIMNPPVTLAAIMGLISGFAIVSGIVLLIGAFRLSSAKQEVLNAVRSARA